MVFIYYPPSQHPANFLSKGVRLGLSQKSRRWAVLGVLLIVGTFWDGPRMTPFHMKEQISCQSGANVALTRKMADGTY